MSRIVGFSSNRSGNWVRMLSYAGQLKITWSSSSIALQIGHSHSSRGMPLYLPVSTCRSKHDSPAQNFYPILRKKCVLLQIWHFLIGAIPYFSNLSNLYSSLEAYYHFVQFPEQDLQHFLRFANHPINRFPKSWPWKNNRANRGHAAQN